MATTSNRSSSATDDHGGLIGESRRSASGIGSAASPMQRRWPTGSGRRARRSARRRLLRATTPTAVAALRTRRWRPRSPPDGWGANPWRANPWRANPWRANSWSANPWRANAEGLNVVATGRPPTSSVMPAPFRTLPPRPASTSNGVVIGVLDSGLAGGWDNTDGYRPALLGADAASMQRISGPPDVPSQPMGSAPPTTTSIRSPGTARSSPGSSSSSRPDVRSGSQRVLRARG